MLALWEIRSWKLSFMFETLCTPVSCTSGAHASSNPFPSPGSRLQNSLVGEYSLKTCQCILSKLSEIQYGVFLFSTYCNLFSECFYLFIISCCFKYISSSNCFSLQNSSCNVWIVVFQFIRSNGDLFDALIKPSDIFSTEIISSYFRTFLLNRKYFALPGYSEARRNSARQPHPWGKFFNLVYHGILKELNIKQSRFEYSIVEIVTF